MAVVAEARRKIVARVEERYLREKAEYDEKMARRAAKEKDSSKLPKVPESWLRDSDQINLADEQSRIMPVAGGGIEQAYNAQAGMDAATMLVVAARVMQVPNDKEQRTHAGGIGGVVWDTGRGDVLDRRRGLLQ